MNKIGQKSIVDDIVNQIVAILDLNALQPLIGQEVIKHFKRGLEDMELRLGMNFFHSPEKVKLLNDYTFQNIKDLNSEIASGLRRQIQLGLMNNESVAQISKRIKGVMDVADSRAAMIARTETLRAEEQGRMDAVEQSGIDMRKYLFVTEDHRTSGICKAMHDKYGSPEQAIAMDAEFFVVVNGKRFAGQTPPFHPNCRTVTQYVQKKKRANA